DPTRHTRRLVAQLHLHPTRDIVHVTSGAGHPDTGIAHDSSNVLRQLGHIGGFYAPTGRIAYLMAANDGQSWHGVTATSDSHGNPIPGTFLNTLPAISSTITRPAPWAVSAVNDD
ncbi:hypothetical protein LFM09_49870, partial [Lentzea alba]|uniref:hypothetical protein n=1 Tax=Lentzea alba TaxID=2714351 RepID=UPI0039BED347